MFVYFFVCFFFFFFFFFWGGGALLFFRLFFVLLLFCLFVVVFFVGGVGWRGSVCLFLPIFDLVATVVKCGARGGGQGVRTPPPWEITSYMGFYRE